MNDLIPALAVTVVPVLLLVPVVWALRPQGGRRWLSTRPLPARQVLDRLNREARQGVIPAGPFGDTSRPPAWTVPPAYATADRAATLLRAPACSHGYTTHTNRAGVTMHPNGKPCADRDMTGSFPVVRAAA